MSAKRIEKRLKESLANEKDIQQTQPSSLTQKGESQLTPIPINDAISSLSAILPLAP